MKRSSPSTLTVLAVAGAALAYFVQAIAYQAGRPVFVPPATLTISLLTVAVILIVCAIPIRRAVTGRRRSPINPLGAARVAALAVASSHAGAILLGASTGVLLFMVTRTVIPAVGSVWLAAASVMSSAALLAAALVAEFLCTLPKDDDDDPPGTPEPS